MFTIREVLIEVVEGLEAHRYTKEASENDENNEKCDER